MEEGCQEIQPVSTWSQMETPAIDEAYVVAILVSCLLGTLLIAATLFWW